MKSITSNFLLLFCSLFLFYACKFNDDSDTMGPLPPLASEFDAIQTDAFNGFKQTVAFMAEDGISFESDAGVMLDITGSCLELNGTPVTGEVNLEYVEVFERGDMLISNSTTVGENQSGERGQLISGGAFNIKAYQNGQELTLSCGMMISVPTTITGGEVPGMGAFTGEIDADGNLVWLPQNTEFWVGQDDTSTVYNSFIQNFGWFNCDVFIADPDPKTEIQIGVPSGFDNTNSSVYLAREGEPNSLAFLYGEFPVGLNAHIIFLSESEGAFLYAIESITVSDGQQVSFPLDELNLATPEELTQIINDLP